MPNPLPNTNIDWAVFDSRKNLSRVRGEGKGGGHCEIFSTGSRFFICIVFVRLAS